MTFNPTAWIDGRLAVLGKSVAEGVVDAVAAHIDTAESNILTALTSSSDHVIASVGTTVADTVGKITVDTASLAAAVVTAIKGLLPFPFRAARRNPKT